MFFNDAFGIFGHFAFSSKPTHGRSIYTSLVDGMGDAYNTDFNSYQQGRLYAQSICLASAQYQLDRALNNRDPSKATELLGQLENDFQVTPGTHATLKQRRDFLAALFMVARGNSQEAIELALTILLGSDFVSYDHFDPSTWPTSPGAVGVFAPTNSSIKQFRILSSIYVTGVSVNVPYSTSDQSDDPIPGETYCVDPDPRRAIEQVTIEDVLDPGTSFSSIITTFANAHDFGAFAVRPYPLWLSARRYSTVTIKLAAAIDPEKRRLINELMSRAVRATAQWCVVSDQGDFVLDSSTAGLIGYTTLG